MKTKIIIKTTQTFILNLGFICSCKFARKTRNNFATSRKLAAYTCQATNRQKLLKGGKNSRRKKDEGGNKNVGVNPSPFPPPPSLRLNFSFTLATQLRGGFIALKHILQRTGRSTEANCRISFG